MRVSRVNGSYVRTARGRQLVAACLIVAACSPCAQSQTLYWAQVLDNQIQRVTLGGTPEPLLQSSVADLALDVPGQALYWTQTVEDRIVRWEIDGGDPQTIVTWPAADGPTAIHVDAAAGFIYWAQLGGPRIMRADLDGANATPMVE